MSDNNIHQQLADEISKLARQVEAQRIVIQLLNGFLQSEHPSAKDDILKAVLALQSGQIENNKLNGETLAIVRDLIGASGSLAEIIAFPK